MDHLHKLHQVSTPGTLKFLAILQTRLNVVCLLNIGNLGCAAGLAVLPDSMVLDELCVVYKPALIKVS